VHQTSHSSLKERDQLRRKLAAEFDVIDLGKLKYFLGIKVARSTQGIFMSQQKYVLDLLKETGTLGCKPSDAPIEPNHRFGEVDKGAVVDKGRYQKLIGNW